MKLKDKWHLFNVEGAGQAALEIERHYLKTVKKHLIALDINVERDIPKAVTKSAHAMLDYMENYVFFGSFSKDCLHFLCDRLVKDFSINEIDELNARTVLRDIILD